VRSNLHIALRFLTFNRRAMLMSLAGIVLGVGFFIFAQAQTSGFEKFFIQTILGTNGALRIQDRFQDTVRAMEVGGGHGDAAFVITHRESVKYIEGIETPQALASAIKEFANVSGVSEVLTGSVTASNGFRIQNAKAIGIHLEDYLAVSSLEDQVIFGTLSDFRMTPTGLIMGSRLAHRMEINIGDSIVLEAVGQKRRYAVSAIFETGVSDIDRERLFLHMGEARTLFKKPHGASYLQVGLLDPQRAFLDAEHMSMVLGHHVASWQEREKTWLDAFKVLRFSSALTMATILLLAGLGMFNTLALMVMEKTREIAILRSMGYTRRDIGAIFLWQGLLVLCAGSVLGWILAGTVTLWVSHLPFRVTGIFSTDQFVVHWSIWHYVSATVIAALVIMVASIVPARKAAYLEPAEVIRETSG